MNYSTLNTYDTANGEGIRVSLFVSGCRLKCKGCFNPEAHDFNFGSKFTEDTMNAILKALEPDYINGFSLLGGDPLEPENKDTCLYILSRIKEKFPNKNIWMWTGRTKRFIEDEPILDYVDVLVDGPFVEKLKDTNLMWRGSANQKIYHLNKQYLKERLDGAIASETIRTI